jgi:nucleoid DNA-binding protein
MDKRELITLAARRSTLTRRQVEEALHAILETVAEAIAAGEPVILKDFGRFSTWQRRQRIRGFDGQAHDVDEVQLAFKASAILRRRLKGESSQAARPTPTAGR